MIDSPRAGESQRAGAKPLPSLFYESRTLVRPNARPAVRTAARGNVTRIDDVPESSWFHQSHRHHADGTATDSRAAQLGHRAGAGAMGLLREKSGPGPNSRLTARRCERPTCSCSSTRPSSPSSSGAVESRPSCSGRSATTRSRPSSRDSILRASASIEARVSGRPARERRSARRHHPRASSVAARNATGTYRASARNACCREGSRTVPLLGHTGDDPNDLVPHEHRPAARAARVRRWTNPWLEAATRSDSSSRKTPYAREALPAERRLDLSAWRTTRTSGIWAGSNTTMGRREAPLSDYGLR